MTPRVTNAVLALKMDNIDNRIDKLAKTVEEHEKLLRGNGELGLRATVKKHTETLNEVKWWTRLAFGAIILDLIGRWISSG